MISINGVAQGPLLNWALGDSALIQIPESGGPLFVRNTPIYSLEAMSTLSDSDGNLLAYTNSAGVWDRRDSLMPGADDLTTYIPIEIGSSIAQGCLFIPQPGDDKNRYYWVLTHVTYPYLENAIEASLIDMTLNAGFGGIVDSSKKLSIHYNVTEQLHAVRHSNGEDWWVFSKPIDADSTNLISRALLTADGWTTLSNITLPVNIQAFAGEIISSNDGCLLAVVSARGTIDGSLAIFNLDRENGELSLIKFIESNQFWYSAAFSPNGNYVYVGRAIPAGIIQFSTDSSDTSFDVIYENSAVSSNLGDLELAADGKVYFNQISPLTNHGEYLGVIHNPDSSSSALIVDDRAFFVGLPTDYSLGLPDFPNYVFEPKDCNENPIDTTVSILEEPELLSHWITPTISSGIFRIFPNQGIVSVLSLSGKLEKQQNLPVQYLDLSNLESGMYLVRLERDNQILTTKVFISR